jgi:hypothetical protein
MKKYALAVILLLCLPLSAQRTKQQGSATVTVSGTTATFTNDVGGVSVSIELVRTGGPASVSIPIAGCMRGGTCDTLETYVTNADSVRTPNTSNKVYDYYTVTPSWTGGTNPTVIVNITTTLARAGVGGLSNDGTNIISTQPLTLPNGTAALPALRFTADGTTGWSRQPTAWEFSSQTFGCCVLGLGGVNSVNGLAFASNWGIQWTNTINNPNATIDTGITRSASGIAAVGSGGAAGDTTGKLKAAGYISAGTKFSSNSGCTEGTLVGGATAGKFTVGQNTACTIIITMGDTATAPNGWTCTAYDQTAVPAVAIRQTASTATTCSLLMTVAISDVIAFSAIGY